MKRSYKEYVPKMLLALGRLYALTSLGYHKVSLCKFMEDCLGDYPYASIAAVQVVRTGITTRDGRSQKIKWSTSPPSLQMAESLMAAIDANRLAHYQAKKRKEKACRRYDEYRLVAGVASRTCRQCPYRNMNPCEFFRDIGFECRRYDMRTVKLEKVQSNG